MSKSELSVGQATLLVAEREITTQIRTRSFLISTAVTLVLILAGIILPSIFAGDGSSDTTKVAVVSGTQLPAAAGLEPTEVADRAAGEELLRSEEVEAVAVTDPSSPTGFALIGISDVPSGVQNLLSVQPTVELLEPSTTSDAIRSIVVIAFGIVFMITALGSGAMIVQNTVMEKQSRIVEILLAAVPAKALLAGKILGNTVIGVGQAVAMAVTAAVGLAVSGQAELLSLLSAPMIWFIVFFLFGFMLVASLFAAAGSLVSRQEDTGSVMSPVMMLIMLPYFAVIFFGDNPTVMTVLSYVPFSAPLAMPVRLFFGEAQWWEPLISLVLLLLTAAVVAVLASKVYTRSLLRMGGRVSLKDALKSS